jgi:hypothetical protein
MEVIWGKTRMWAIVILIVIASGMLLALRLRQTGLAARIQPTLFETLVSRQVRLWLVPATAQKVTNPLPANEEILKQDRDHWADHADYVAASTK